MSIFALILISVGLFAVQGLSAQKRVIKVQGHPHEYLTDKYGGKEDAGIRTAISPQEGGTTYIEPGSIECWIDQPRLDLSTEIDTNGYWGYYRADNRRIPIPSADFDNDPDAARFGITYEPLQNQQVHGLVFEPNIGGFIYEVHQFDTKKIRYMDCICAPCPQYITSNNKTSKKK
jgi:hypothetical protein